MHYSEKSQKTDIKSRRNSTLIHPDVSAILFFGRLILDSLNRTENAMPQGHAFKAAKWSMNAQALADRINKESMG